MKKKITEQKSRKRRNFKVVQKEREKGKEKERERGPNKATLYTQHKQKTAAKSQNLPPLFTKPLG